MLDALHYPFIQNALLTGTFVAIIAAITGYFLISRGLTFAGHALPNIGFAGAAGAVLIGVNVVYGLFVFTIAAAIGMGLLGKEVRDRDISIGVLMTFALGIGLMFLALYSGYAQRVYSILFGTILGISRNDVKLTAISALITVGIFLFIYRPLLFSTFDPLVAEARGVPVRFLSIFFLVLVAVTVSLSIQVMGALLVFTLLVGPAATATRLVQRPLWAIFIAIVLGIAYIWISILLAALNGNIPVSFFIATLAFIIYLPVRFLTPVHRRRSISHS
ncbi:MAG TPA: ABC transporter permease [Firmicutes bacterium]|jgi:zinc/manganese transport system permease protein|nr:ABC transporter permease [Bacillota bacterium]